MRSVSVTKLRLLEYIGTTWFLTTVLSLLGPHEFTSVTFPVKVLKLLVHDLRSKSESATFPGGEGFVDTDDEDEEWTEEEQQHQGFKADEFAFLSEMLGPRGVNLDNDDIFDDNDDEDLKNDPISHIDVKVSDLLTSLARYPTDTWRHVGAYRYIFQRLRSKECQ